MGLKLNKKSEAISEINITPFVDVVLVLLIIFMVTAPLMYNSLLLKLPSTKKVRVLNVDSSQVVLSYTRTGEFFIGKNKLLESELIDVLKSQLQEKKQETLFLQADYSLTYGKVAKVMAMLKRGGIFNLALVTEVEK